MGTRGGGAGNHSFKADKVPGPNGIGWGWALQFVKGGALDVGVEDA